MRINFLYAADGTPLAKSFLTTGDGHEVEPYPHVRDFDSVEETPKTLADFHAVLIQHAANNACLLKGHLNRELSAESRAGHTNGQAPTSWLNLDLDFSEGFDSVDDFLATIDPALANVSYIFHPSASAAINDKPGLRGHVILLTDREYLPATLKHWLKSANMNTPALYEQTSLSANGHALKFPLDISTCQNDKLLYIAPPIVDGRQFDPGDYIQLVQKERDRACLTLNLENAAATETAIQTRINTLRKAAGLRKRAPKYKNDILLNPDNAVVTGIREARGFVYLNLNGGDSWAYYFPKDKPDVVHNFKEEPDVYLRHLAPDLWAEYKPTAKQQVNNLRAFAIHDQLSDNYYSVEHNTDTDDLEIHQLSNLTKVNHFLAQRGLPEIEDGVEDWTVQYDPTMNERVDYANHKINTFIPSAYMRARYAEADVKPFPIIERVLRHLAGELYEYLINHLAAIFQYRIKTQTAYIFTGTTGTGKGLLFHKILTPLFGETNCNAILISNLEEQFNGYALNALITWLDEAFTDERHATKIMNALKNLITETRMPVRLMRTNPQTVDVYNNVFAGTNHDDPFPLQDNDRRFNVAPPQHNQLEITPEEVDQIENELSAFAAHLALYDVDLARTRRPIENQARADMIRAGSNTTDRFFAALRNAELEYFLSFRDGEEKKAYGSLPDLGYKAYREIIDGWHQSAGRKITVPRSDLEMVYSYLQGRSVTPTKFARMCSLHRVHLSHVHHNGNTVQGITLTFPETPHNDLPANVTALRPCTTDRAQPPTHRTMSEDQPTPNTEAPKPTTTN
jgi:hypothetical protein